MRVRLEGEGQWPIVQTNLHHTTTRAADLVAHFDRASPQRGRLATQPEEAPDDEAQGDARATRVNTPTAVEGDRALRDAAVFVARVITVLERRIRARVVAV